MISVIHCFGEYTFNDISNSMFREYTFNDISNSVFRGYTFNYMSNSVFREYTFNYISNSVYREYTFNDISDLVYGEYIMFVIQCLESTLSIISVIHNLESILSVTLVIQCLKVTSVTVPPPPLYPEGSCWASPAARTSGLPLLSWRCRTPSAVGTFRICCPPITPETTGHLQYSNLKQNLNRKRCRNYSCITTLYVTCRYMMMTSNRKLSQKLETMWIARIKISIPWRNFLHEHFKKLFLYNSFLKEMH